VIFVEVIHRAALRT